MLICYGCNEDINRLCFEKDCSCSDKESCLWCCLSTKCVICEYHFCTKCSILLREPDNTCASIIACSTCFEQFNKNKIVKQILNQTGSRTHYGTTSGLLEMTYRKEYIIERLNSIKNVNMDIISDIISYIQAYISTDNEIYLTDEQNKFLLNQINKNCVPDDNCYIDILNMYINRQS